MADNRNWDEQRSNEWNESGNRFGKERNDDQNRSRSRNEGYGNSDWNRSRQDDYNTGSYDQNRYGNEYDRNNNFGSRSDFNRTSRRGDSWGSSYGDAFDTYMDYNRQNRGGAGDYRGNYGSGSEYNGGTYGSGMYGNNYGNRSRSEGYGGGFGFGERSNFGDREYNYGSSGNRQRGDYSRGQSSEYNRNRPGSDERTWWDKTTDEVSSWFGDEDAERRRRQDGTRKGRGPKNYKRSDERIKEDINDRLSDDWFIDASEVDIAVSAGEVTITGTVDDRSSKRRVEDMAESVSGVKHVENRLRVSSGQQQSTGSYATTSGATSIGTGSSGTEGTSSSKSKSSYAETK